MSYQVFITGVVVLAFFGLVAVCAYLKVVRYFSTSRDSLNQVSPAFATFLATWPAFFANILALYLVLGWWALALVLPAAFLGGITLAMYVGRDNDRWLKAARRLPFYILPTAVAVVIGAI